MDDENIQVFLLKNVPEEFFFFLLFIRENTSRYAKCMDYSVSDLLNQFIG